MKFDDKHRLSTLVNRSINVFSQHFLIRDRERKKKKNEKYRDIDLDEFLSIYKE